jgi:folate-binding protein YgfZ
MKISSTHSIIQISGIDSAEFLQGQITNDINLVSNDKFIDSAVCNVQGRVISLFMIRKYAEDFQIIVDSSLSVKLLNHLKKYAVFFKTEMNIINELSKGLVVISDEEWEKDCIKKGRAEINDHLSEKFTPHELNYHNNEIINFQKGCFTGQEVIARMQYRGKLKFALARFGIKKSQLMERGEMLTNHAGKNIGQVIMFAGNIGLMSLKNSSNLENDIFKGNKEKVHFTNKSII